jgi:hypothetical protein
LNLQTQGQRAGTAVSTVTNKRTLLLSPLSNL